MAERDEVAALIIACANRDRAAFRRLYHGTSAKILGVVIRIIRSRAEAEEILQDVYVTVWSKAEAFSPEVGTGMAWLVSIARHRAIDVIRSRKVAATDNWEPDQFEKLTSQQNAELESRDRIDLAKCLLRLEPPIREMILYAYVNGASREELAAHFGYPVNTIKTKLRRGLLDLHSCLEGKS